MEELAHLQNASATFTQIANEGPPSPPIQFTDPKVDRAQRVTATVVNPHTGEEASVPNIIYRISSKDATDEPPPEKAYWIGRKLRKAIYGCVRSCTVLRLQDPGGPDKESRWEVTPEMAAVKIMDWNAVKSLKDRHVEDPVKEVAAMQFLCRDGTHPKVIRSLDVFYDEQYLYSFMPFCTSGELFGFVQRDGRFKEAVARFWFRQVLDGLSFLQKRGVCHRDLSLENLLVDKNTECLVIDLGMCLRVPFSGDDGSITDVSACTFRRLICPQGPCGKPNYISPEVLRNDPFDGFAIDLWATGVILFIMLVGLPPFEWASEEDARFVMISRGGLTSMLKQWGRMISDEAADLLQNMLMKDPKDRLSLMEVLDHKWVCNGDIEPPSVPQDDDWRS